MRPWLPWLGFTLSVALYACGHKSSRELLEHRLSQAKPRTASYGSDHFYNDLHYNDNPKKIPPDDFFFKKCRINQFSPYPSMHQWDCTEAMK
jgi:hypothetical protein